MPKWNDLALWTSAASLADKSDPLYRAVVVSKPREPERAADLVLLGFVTGVLVLATPLRGLWASPESSWWLPFAVWLAVIVVAGLSARAWMRHGD